MKKKIIIAIFILILLISGATFYLNKVVLPVKLKSLAIQWLEEATQKKVKLDEIKFNIFKGLVLDNLVIYDDSGSLLSAKEVSCTFFIMPIIKKRIIVPGLYLESPIVYLERRPDNTLNLSDLFSAAGSKGTESKFSVFIYKISVRNARIDFHDKSISPAFSKRLDGLDFNLSLGLPAKVRFNLKPGTSANIKIKASGEFRIPEKELQAKIILDDFSPKEFAAYYRKSGISVSDGAIDAEIGLNLKDYILDAELQAKSANLVFSKDKILANLNSEIATIMRYNFNDKQFSCAGQANILGAEASGVDFVDKISGITGEVKFNDQGLSCDKLIVRLADIPIEAKFSLRNFKKPLLKVDFISEFDLDSLKKVIKDKLQQAHLEDVRGKAKLFVKIETGMPVVPLRKIEGFLDLSEAVLKLDKVEPAFSNINGRVEFTRDKIKWQDLGFQYQDIAYKTSGALSGFLLPVIELNLSSEGLFLESTIALKDKLINLSKLNGQYYNSKFSFEGAIDVTQPPALGVSIVGGMDIDLQDTKRLFKKFQKQLEQINPAGQVHLKLDIEGDIKDSKTCAIEATLTGPAVSFYGLKGNNLLIDYDQSGGMGDVSIMRLSLYDGTLEAAAKIDLNSQGTPYSIEVAAKGIKLQKLKLDTPAKEKDISGTIQADLKLSGVPADISRLNGVGNILITEGNLWQLDLFKGMGGLIFTKDFSNIIFNEGACSFMIKDKYVSTDNLKLKSSFVNLSGYAKIGFDATIDAAVDVEVISELAPLSGTFKDLATAIIGKAGSMGTMKISGTLKEPNYKFHPAVVNIIQSLKDTFMGKGRR